MATGAAARIAAGGGTVKSDGTKKDKKRKREKNDDMKRTGYPRRGTCTGRWVLAIVLARGLLASCSTSDSEDTMPLPEGKFPLQLTAEVTQPQTRAGGKDAWTGGEEIRVAMEGVFGTKTYVMDASGNASPKDADNAFYWKNTTETRITAWTLNLEMGETETDISDQTKGYAAFDVLAASTIGRYDQTVNLCFVHRMAKIEVTLKAGEGITEEDLEGATATLFGDPLTHSTGGLVAPGNQSDGEIKPYYDAATKKYEALVPPQDMTGKPLVRISIDNKAFTYTPDTEAAGKFDFFGGKRYAYDITVKADGIDVQKVTGATWGYDGEEDVASARLFKADELKVGDYFYSDGTWSDGGLRKQYADGRVVTADPKPAPVEGKTVVGIVFQTNPSRIGAAEKAKLGGEDKVHGLVMCVKNAATGKWNPENKDAWLTKCQTKAENYNDISGYGNCEHIRSSRGNFDNYPAFKAADDYSSTCPVPATTTGWFLPSSGQWWDILQNLGGCTALADATQQTSSDSNYLYWKGQGDVPAALNAWMEKIAADNKSNFNSNEWFWSSSEDTENHARSWCFGSSGFVISVQNAKDRSLLVRPVLAF